MAGKAWTHAQDGRLLRAIAHYGRGRILWQRIGVKLGRTGAACHMRYYALTGRAKMTAGTDGKLPVTLAKIGGGKQDSIERPLVERDLPPTIKLRDTILPEKARLLERIGDMYRREANDTRHPLDRIFGDPPPGRSALDQLRARAVERSKVAAFVPRGNESDY